MAFAVNLVVTCTKRKTRPVPAALRLRTVPGDTLQARSRDWVQRLAAASAEVAVAELYAGDHWSVVRSLTHRQNPLPYRVQVWVCSAGYGLLGLPTRVSPYSATFTPGDPDSVRHSLPHEQLQAAPAAWWQFLAEWEGPEPGIPRTVTALARTFPTSPLLVAASGAYLGALRDDLVQTVDVLSDPELLSVISAGSRSLGPLDRHRLPCDARLRRAVGGALTSLNVRLARRVLSDLGGVLPTLPLLRKHLTRLLNEQTPSDTPRRQSLTDEQVQEHVRAALRQDRRSRPTPLLQRLRGAGYACEQARFTALFHQVREQLDGP